MMPALVPLLDEIIVRAAAWPRSALTCPQCGRSLYVAQHAGLEIDLCRHCHAVWLDGGEVDRLAGQALRAQLKEEAEAEIGATLFERLGPVGKDDLARVVEQLAEALGQWVS